MWRRSDAPILVFMYALSPETLIKTYALGLFPMAEAHDDERLLFIDPAKRGILPLDTPHIPKRLKRKIKQNPYTITVNQAFDAVIDGCRTLTKSRNDTWINPQIRQLCCALHRLGFAHSVETWQQREDSAPILVGGLYGIALAGAFFGESMFAQATDASKIALVHLMARLRHGGFALLDTQFTNPHLGQFGVEEISRDAFKKRLEVALATDARFPLDSDDSAMVQALLQASTETS